MRTVIFARKRLGLSGIYTLIKRLSEQLINNNVYLYCESIPDVLKNELESENVRVEKLSAISTLLSDSNAHNIITFELDEYLELKRIFRNKKTRVVLYVVHPKLFSDFEGTHYIYKKIIHSSMKQFVEEEIRNKNIFFMDFQCLDSALIHYGISYDDKNKKDSIVHLMTDYSMTNELLLNNRSSTDFNILTISRADFPFKGYMLGLIRDYENLKTKYPFISLTIISYGDCVKEISKQIAGLNVDVKLIEGLPYDELDYFYKHCSLYIGMGTTIIEASSRGIPSLPVQSYTYECKSNGFFSDFPEWVSADFGEPVSIQKFVELVLKEDNSLYEMKSKEGINTVRSFYSPESVFQQFKNIVFVEDKQRTIRFPYSAYFMKMLRNYIKKQ